MTDPVAGLPKKSTVNSAFLFDVYQAVNIPNKGILRVQNTHFRQISNKNRF